jgi:hypothetical protein
MYRRCTRDSHETPPQSPAPHPQHTSGYSYVSVRSVYGVCESSGYSCVYSCIDVQIHAYTHLHHISVRCACVLYLEIMLLHTPKSTQSRVNTSVPSPSARGPWTSHLSR